MREELEKHKRIAELKIVAALQEFHNNTGLIPTAFTFDMLDVSKIEDLEKGRKVCVVGNHQLIANT